MFAILLLAAALNAASGTQVLPEVRAGNWLCSNPDLSTKTCTAIAVYTMGPNDTFTETGEVLISPDQALTVEIPSNVQIDGAQICGTLENLALQKGKVRLGGILLPPDRNALAMSKIAEKLKPMAGHKVCEELRIEGGNLMKYGQVDGVALSLPGKPVRWVAPAEGYRVAPR